LFWTGDYLASTSGLELSPERRGWKLPAMHLRVQLETCVIGTARCCLDTPSARYHSYLQQTHRIYVVKASPSVPQISHPRLRTLSQTFPRASAPLSHTSPPALLSSNLAYLLHTHRPVDYTSTTCLQTQTTPRSSTKRTKTLARRSNRAHRRRATGREA
jgi:hypothetical protein